MRPWKIVWMLVAACLVMAGCTTEDEPCVADADCGLGQRCEKATGECVAKVDRNLACASASDCLASEICHPTAKVCVQTCSASADCPDTAKTCTALSSTDSRTVCQCSTDALCNVDRLNPGLVCADLDKVCRPKCAADADCGSGRTCDTTTGQCKAQVEKSLRCTTDTDCLASEICHPTAKVCVQTCSASVDCPDAAKTCAAVSARDSRKVCQCATDALCNADRTTPDLVCSIPFSVCTPKCTTDPECGTGYVCDTPTGQCKLWGGTGAPCSGAGQSNCYYGTHFCSTNQCAPLPAPTCPNYTNFSSKNSLGTTGPIIYGAQVLSTAIDTVYCGSTTPKRVKVSVSAYSSVPFPANKDELSGFFFVKSDGTVVNGSLQVSASAGNYIVSGANRELADIVVSLCTDTSSTTYATGFYFTSGNFLCFQANYQ